jgi:hypothetical protein
MSNVSIKGLLALPGPIRLGFLLIFQQYFLVSLLRSSLSLLLDALPDLK